MRCAHGQGRLFSLRGGADGPRGGPTSGAAARRPCWRLAGVRVHFLTLGFADKLRSQKVSGGGNWRGALGREGPAEAGAHTPRCGHALGRGLRLPPGPAPLSPHSPHPAAQRLRCRELTRLPGLLPSPSFILSHFPFLFINEVAELSRNPTLPQLARAPWRPASKGEALQTQGSHALKEAPRGTGRGRDLPEVAPQWSSRAGTRGQLS